MHIVNATLNNGGRSSNVSKILRFIKDVQRIVEETYQVHLDENELNFSRFITHLKFLGQHMFSNQKTKKEELGDLYAFLIKRNDKMEHCIHQIRETIKEKYHYELQENEQVYLMIHIGKLID